MTGRSHSGLSPNLLEIYRIEGEGQAGGKRRPQRDWRRDLDPINHFIAICFENIIRKSSFLAVLTYRHRLELHFVIIAHSVHDLWHPPPQQDKINFGSPSI